MAERHDILEKELLQEELQGREALLKRERRAAALVEAERLQRGLRAQEAVLQADRESAGRLADRNGAILSDREFAERLQAEIEWGEAVELPITPAMTGYGEERSSVGSRSGRSPIDQVRNGTQQSQPRASNEEEMTRVVKEEGKMWSKISAWQKKTGQGADRLPGRRGIHPTKARASPQGRTSQHDQAQASRGFQAAPNFDPATNELGDEGECVACTESFPKSRLVRPCEHFYCRGCLAGKTITLMMFERAIKDTASVYLPSILCQGSLVQRS